MPQPNAEREEPLLTDAPVTLDAQLRAYFERKIRQSLTARGLAVVADPNESDVVRNGVAAVLRDERQLVAVSQAAAHHLDRSQTRRNPAGLLAVGLGAIDEGRVVTVLKLEREQGLRLRIEVVGDHTEVDMQFLRDLALTDKTKIFKTALLRLEAGGAESMYGLVSDDQRGRDEGAGVASFFLATFLGCRLKTNAEKATLDFVLAAEEFINADVASDERRAGYQVALLATMQDQSLDLRPREFAEQHLEPDHRPRFLERVAARGLDPNATFQKDTSLARVRGFKMVFEHGMTLIGSGEDLSERVRVRHRAGENGVLIEDTLKRLSGR